MAELAVLSQAPPAEETATAQKAQRSTDGRRFIRRSRCRAPQESRVARLPQKTKYAGVAELADALALGASVTDVQVQVLSPVPNSGTNQIVCFGIFSLQ